MYSVVSLSIIDLERSYKALHEVAHIYLMEPFRIKILNKLQIKFHYLLMFWMKDKQNIFYSLLCLYLPRALNLGRYMRALALQYMDMSLYNNHTKFNTY